MELTPEQRTIRDVVREFAEDELRPADREGDRTETFPEDVWDGLAELELTGLTVPESYGGFDADRTTYAVVNEAVAYGSLSVATALSVHCLATACIAEFADESLREDWLPEMVDGRPVGAFALSEPAAGSNPAEMRTVARRDDDEYVLDGEKQWITNATRAGAFVVFAKVPPGDVDGGDAGDDSTGDEGGEPTDASGETADPGSGTADAGSGTADAGSETAADDDPAAWDTVTQFLVPADADGLTVGEPESKLGLRASDTASLTFDDVRIPADHRLTEPGRGLAAAFRILTGGRVGIAAQAVGLAQAAFDDAVAYAGEREQFGQSIDQFQAIRHDLAEMRTDLQAARLLTFEAARRLEADDPDAPMAASMAKYRASEAAMAVTERAVQIHGGYGYVTEFDVERYYRDAKVTEIYEGTTEIQKEIVARHVFDEA